MDSRARAQRVWAGLTALYPKTEPFLDYTQPWELMVAVQLSAQCTDKRVNEITPKLFARYPTLDDYVTAHPPEFEEYIYSSGYYRNKTKNILAAARMVRDEFHGELPRTMQEMLRIPGVARKTANVVLDMLYGVHEGIAVDTHVKRVALALGLTDSHRVIQIERDLMEQFHPDSWGELTRLMILFGRTYCPAKRHDHRACERALKLEA